MAALEFVFWYWWVIAVVLLVVEILTPGFFFLWMSVSGLITGIMVWAIPSVSFNVQVLVFSVLSLLSISAWRFYGKKSPLKTDQPLLNKRGAQYVGRVFNLYAAIENGRGKIKVDDSIWTVHGEDCALNSKVRVLACRGTVFDVEKVD